MFIFCGARVIARGSGGVSLADLAFENVSQSRFWGWARGKVPPEEKTRQNSSQELRGHKLGLLCSSNGRSILGMSFTRVLRIMRKKKGHLLVPMCSFV